MSALADAKALLAQGRAEEALAAILPAAATPNAGHAERSVHAGALKALGRMREALAVNEAALAAFPDDPIAEHNLAATHGDLDQAAEAEAAARRALAKGGDAAETWLVLGRALTLQGQFDSATEALREAVNRNPLLADAQRDLSQLIWMRSGDVHAAVEPLTAALQANPDAAALAVQLATALEAGGETEAALQALRRVLSARREPSYDLELAAANLCVRAGRPREGLDHATRAMQARPNDFSAAIAACDAFFGLGDARNASVLAERMLSVSPGAQHVLARQYTAWRLLGDPRAHELYDYSAMVRPRVIDTPDGWASLDAYLADLRAALRRAHGFETHPFGQSLRHGSQTSRDLTLSDDPAIRAFFAAIDQPIRRYMSALGEGTDPLRRFNGADYGFAGVWSILLRPYGFHVDHVHPAGWLSSACYIELPPGVEAGGREGWIKFGQPGVPTTPKLEPEHYVKPEPGMLVLFPSYMWHGTVPFSGEHDRMTIAFDVVPK